MRALLLREESSIPRFVHTLTLQITSEHSAFPFGLPKGNHTRVSPTVVTIAKKIGGVFAGGPRVLGLENRPTPHRHPLTEVGEAGTALA